mgnify:CR=1 FL=1
MASIDLDTLRARIVGGADFQAIVAGMLAQKGEPATAAWLKGLKTNSKT